MRVSFDFDGTLDKPEVQEYCKELMERGVEVFVCTYRYDELRKHLWLANPTNDDLWEVIDKLGVDRRNVVFTCMQPKSSHLLFSDVKWHLDDMIEVLFDMKENSGTPAIFIGDYDWKEKCNNLLEL